MNESFTSWDEILFGVPHGSILGPLLFNILISNLFITIDDINIVNFPFVSGNTLLWKMRPKNVFNGLPIIT